MKHLTIIACLPAVGMAVTLLLTPVGLAEPYQVAYEGDVFPEQDGWDRFTSNGGVDRLIVGSVFRLSSNDFMTADQYDMFMNNQLNAGPDEVFYVEWRLRLCPDPGLADVKVFVGLDNGERDVSLAYSADHFTSFHDDNTVFIDTTVFHTYRIQSFDMFDYDFFVDGELAYSGFFDPPGIASSLVNFGDCCVGQASCSEWDFFRFGAARLGDVNLDGRTNLLDFATFANCFGAPVSGPPAACSDQDARLSDLDQDGLIDLSDFATFALNFGG